MRNRRTFPPALSVVAAVLTLLGSAAAQSRRPERPRRLVEELIISGNRRLSDEDLLSRLETRAGDLYSDARVRRDLSRLRELEDLDPARTRVITEEGVRGGVVVTFEVVERPLLRGVNFEGLGGVGESEVIGALRERGINLSVGAAYDPARGRKAVAVIKEYLASRGWPQAAVTLTEKLGAADVSLSFVVSLEGH